MARNAANDAAEIDLADSLRPRVPVGDDLTAASAVLNLALAHTSATNEELRAIAEHHHAGAPISSQYLLELRAQLARTVIDWIVGWPR